MYSWEEAVKDVGESPGVFHRIALRRSRIDRDTLTKLTPRKRANCSSTPGISRRRRSSESSVAELTDYFDVIFQAHRTGVISGVLRPFPGLNGVYFPGTRELVTCESRNQTR